MSVCLRIVQINDVYELDHFASLATLVKEERGKPNAVTASPPDGFVFLMAGDFVAPSLLSSLDKAASMIDCMNAIGITHACFGNHETDIPMTALAKRVEQSHFIWVNSNMQEINDKLQIATPEYDIVTVRSRTDPTATPKRVALLGLLTDDAGLYRPGSFANATIEPVIPTTDRLIEELLQQPKKSFSTSSGRKDEAAVDLILPMTHQSMEEDRVFAQTFGGKLFPIIMGGHDHVAMDETIRGARIFKTGMNAVHAGIIDVVWNSNHNNNDNNEGDQTLTPPSSPIVQATLVRTADYAPDPDVAARVASHKQLLVELEMARLFRVGSWMDERMAQCVHCHNCDSSSSNGNNSKASAALAFSTRDNRMGPSTGTTALVTMLRMGMRCPCAIINAGSVRGSKDYAHDAFFTWSDLKAEIPFPTCMTARYLPGRVLEATITHSRLSSWEDPPMAKGGYLHTCTNIVYNNTKRKIESIQGEAFDPDRLYLTALPEEFFLGIDNHKPLLEWAETQQAMKEDAGLLAKLVIVEVFSTLLWLQLGSFADLDTDDDGQITREDIATRCRAIFGPQIADLVVDNVLSVADLDGSGFIRPLEMMVVQYIATDMLHHVTNAEEDKALRQTVVQVTGYAPDDSRVDALVTRVREIMDKSQDGSLQRDEIRQAVGSIKRQSLLR